MTITYYPTEGIVKSAMQQDDPLLAVISFDGTIAAIAPIDDAVEHHILINKAGLTTNIDEVFRIVVNKEGADWTFVCPSDYKQITDKRRRIAAFYKDGFALITELLSEIGYFVDVTIPRRYRRHFDELM